MGTMKISPSFEGILSKVKRRWQSRVLVVEVDPFIRMTAVDVLGELLQAATADEAVAVLTQRDDVDVVFMDLHMTGSSDILALTQRPALSIPIRKLHPARPAI